jgi:dihydrofolate reductase
VGKVNFDISMSLDGYIAAANQRPGQPMGDGGERLHEWAFGDDPRDREVLEQGVAGSGAVICGRRTYDDSLPWWGADGPTGPARLPVIVVTHSVPHAVPEGSVYTFVTAGIEAALEQAQVVAGDKDVTVMGGAETGQRYLAAGLVDELSVHLVPVLLGNGLRMFDNLGVEPITLENTTAIQTAVATHLRLRVVR